MPATVAMVELQLGVPPVQGTMLFPVVMSWKALDEMDARVYRLGLIEPCLPFCCWTRIATMPAKVGVEADVPPETVKSPQGEVYPCWAQVGCGATGSGPRSPFTQLPSLQVKYPSWSADAVRARSGTSRCPSLGTPVPVCQLGLTKDVLAPPPEAVS